MLSPVSDVLKPLSYRASSSSHSLHDAYCALVDTALSADVEEAATLSVLSAAVLSAEVEDDVLLS